MQTKLFIGGKWSEPSGGETEAVKNPANGEHIADVSIGASADTFAACTAAAKAQTVWAKTAPRHKSEVLTACWLALTENSDQLSELIVAEHGKPLADAKGEVAYSAEFFRWNAEEAVRIDGSLKTSPSGKHRIMVRHPPVGTVAMITPWNFPAAMIARKVAPAIAAGNACVIKPALETPLTALALAQLFAEAGVPDGLINIVPTTDPATWAKDVVTHPATRMLSFTGSTQVGRELLSLASGRVLKTAMELGGNAPFIVFADADLEQAVQGAVLAKMRHSAQTCTAANRFLVESPVANQFSELLAEQMSQLRLGDGLEPDVDCGPMISPTAVSRVKSLVDQAVAGGAKLVTGGSQQERAGNFFAPTVLSGVTYDAEIGRNEIFGPVAPVFEFDDVDKMITRANDTELGLAAYICSGDIGRALAVAEQIQAGMVGINRGTMSDPAAPFGGMKQSGLGREGASEGIYEFTETQYIAVDW